MSACVCACVFVFSCECVRASKDKTYRVCGAAERTSTVSSSCAHHVTYPNPTYTVQCSLRWVSRGALYALKVNDVYRPYNARSVIEFSRDEYTRMKHPSGCAGRKGRVLKYMYMCNNASPATPPLACTMYRNTNSSTPISRVGGGNCNDGFYYFFWFFKRAK